MMERASSTGYPGDAVLFSTQGALRAPVLTWPEWSGLAGVQPRVPRLPAPDDLASGRLTQRTTPPACRPRLSQHRHDVVATVSDYSCYG